jgi:hypothetical protein
MSHPMLQTIPVLPLLPLPTLQYPRTRPIQLTTPHESQIHPAI